MKWIQETLSQEFINAIGWTLIHSIWQGAIIALGFGVLLWILHRHSARLRYLSALSALLLMLVVSVLTFFYFLEPASEPTEISATFAGQEAGHLSVVTHDEPVSVHFVENASFSSVGFWAEITAYFHRHLPMIVVIWLMGVLLLLLRLVGGIAYVQRLKNYRTHAVAENWKRKLASLAHRLQVSKPVRLMESAIIKTPMVIGHLKPVILLPVGLLSGLPPEQVEVILAHELAHIRRHDYVINILQRMVELLFFYHPAIWWLSAMVRTEREHCCDDMAVGISGNTLIFAKALASIQELGMGQPAMAMSFAGKRKQILSRVNRLLKGSSIVFSPTEGFVMTGILFFSFFLINLNASAKLDPHEAVEFMGGGIENHNVAENDAGVQPSFQELAKSPVAEPDTIVDPSDEADTVFSLNITTDDSLPQSFAFSQNGRTFTISNNGNSIFHLDSLMPTIMNVPAAVSFAGVAPFQADTIIEKAVQAAVAFPPVPPARVMFAGEFGGYVPIAERFDNVTGSFTINYEEEDRKYKTIKLTTEQGKVTSLEVNGEKISAIAMDAMIAEIDREGREFGRKQTKDHVMWNFGEDGTFHWNGEDFEFDEEWEEKMEEQMERHREQIDRAHEQAQRLQERALELQEEQQLRMEARRLEQEARRIGQMDERKNQVIIDELFRDELIESKDKVELEISANQMEVNGKKQPKEVQEKYIDLLEDVLDIQIKGDSEFNLNYSDDEE